MFLCTRNPVRVNPGVRVHSQDQLEAAMRRALELALRGPSDTPNPQVGCVLLDAEGNTVAEGWHMGAGTAHAEVDALSKLNDHWRAHAAELTAVVTLEPCNHTGRTGPCAIALAEAGIGAVVYAAADESPQAGGGARTLTEAGVSVSSGVLREEAEALIAPWLARQRAAEVPSRRPRVTVKWAQTLDGRAAAADGSSKWITGQDARDDVHRRRAMADVIMVGTGTLIADDPSLTARATDGTLLVPAEQQPMPVVIGKRAIAGDARIREHPAIAAHGLSAPMQFDGSDIGLVLDELAAIGVRSVFVEGGPALISSFMAEGLADEVLVYIAPSLLGGPGLAIGDIGAHSIADLIDLRITHMAQLGPDLLITASVHP